VFGAVVHLLELLLMFNSAERLTADEALSHVYLADCQYLYNSDSTACRFSVSKMLIVIVVVVVVLVV